MVQLGTKMDGHLEHLKSVQFDVIDHFSWDGFG